MERSVFGMRLVSLRKARNMTQDQVAGKLAINRSTYTCYEIGTSMPNIPTLCQLAEMFEVSLDFLLGRCDNIKGTDVAQTLSTAEEMQMIERYRLLSPKRRRLIMDLMKEF